MDVPETYRVGEALSGEVFPGPFTEKPMLADWAAARNLGWERLKADYVLFLDADDVVHDKGTELSDLIFAMSAEEFDITMTVYEANHDIYGRCTNRMLRERVARVGRTKWIRRIHEGFDMTDRKVVAYQSGLTVVDRRDNRGDGTRIPNRNLKVAYLACREEGWDKCDPAYLMYLVKEAMVTMPELAIAAGRQYLLRSKKNVQRAWVMSLMGEIHEGLNEPGQAMTLYMSSIAELKSSTTYLKAAKLAHDTGDYAKTVSLYEEGLGHKPSAIEDYPQRAEAVKVLYVNALAEVGRLVDAQHVLVGLVEKNPNAPMLKNMLVRLDAAIAKRDSR
jgi:hypothetical protein